MPFVHIELIKGRTPEQLTAMMKDVTEAVHKDTGAPKEHIHVLIRELGEHSYGNNGEWRA
ncbi:MAG: 4-oxalocrotonate tautomerase [Lactobacillus sp.]|jgi:4-oxalocrotonate tautomerase|nr:4-oxalocrotonate tautomerase [Lactobacillus sp.]